MVADRPRPASSSRNSCCKSFRAVVFSAGVKAGKVLYKLQYEINNEAIQFIISFAEKHNFGIFLSILKDRSNLRMNGNAQLPFMAKCYNRR